MVKLTVPQIKKLDTLGKTYKLVEVMNVALLLVGARNGFWSVYDQEPYPFCHTVVKLFSKELCLVTTNNGPLICRKSSVSKKTIKTLENDDLSDKKTIEALRKVLGYTGTAFPRSKYKNVIHVRWSGSMDDDSELQLVQQFAKDSELRACFEEFKVVRQKVDALIGVKICGTSMKTFNIFVVPMDAPISRN